jgi:type III restriction enzyme
MAVPYCGLVAGRRIENPILNSPFEVPTRHFRFDDEGITDEVADGRRPSQYFMPIPASKRRAGAQQELSLTEQSVDRIEETRFVNELRHRVTAWRLSGYPHVTGVSRRLLEYWTDSDRERKLFFAQIEALETVIFLAEAAGKETGGAYFANELRRFSEDANPGLFRVATKMATGTGKTVVMAMIIAWQTLNKANNPQSRTFSDAFLVVCPGITIRDRLRVLLPSDPNDYFRERDLVPPELRDKLGRARIVIVNFHQLKERTKLSAPKVSKAVLGPKAETAGVFVETPDQMARRVCRELGTKRNIVVLNDEAHHCYRRRPQKQGEGATTVDDLKGEEKAEAAQRDEEARVWASGLEAIAAKLGVRTVYDLSATPFFLKGSGYPEGALFPWVVSDFSLIDAIEAGLVKIPRVPVDDDAASPDALPTYRNLWMRIRDQLPKKGRRTVVADGTEPTLPAPLQGALHSLYSNYEKAFARWDEARAAQPDSTPPVFIVVCNNTAVSKMVFDYIAGWAKPQDDGSEVWVPGHLDLFSNVDHGRLAGRAKTILVDSSELESGEAMSDEFKRLAAGEIAEFKQEYTTRFPGRDAEQLTDEDLLREVMNTVGKPGKLGEHVRCVVSVSMLTEGWDANTVTHILGVRAFGTQLLCEQVVGRGLRRRSYVADEASGHFEPEYAEVYGIPFSFIPASGPPSDPTPPKPTHRVRALPGRADKAITFPIVTGYRWEVPERIHFSDFDEESEMSLDSRHVPTSTEVAGVVGEVEVHTLDDLKAQRPSRVAFELTKRLLDRYFRDEPDDDGVTGERPWLFPTLLDIVKRWMADPDQLHLKDNAFPQLLLFDEVGSEAVDRIFRGIASTDPGFNTLKAILRPWDPIGTTDIVDFDTTKDVWVTSPEKCHVTHVAGDSGWEIEVAHRLEAMPEVVSYVKNQGLGFTVPYVIDGRQRQYLPDFIAHIEDGRGSDDLLSLVIEVSGERKKDKEARVAAARDLWVPAVNNHTGFGRWRFVEITDPSDVYATIRAGIPTAARASGVL